MSFRSQSRQFVGILKGERIYEHENENANAQHLAVLRDAGWLDADKCICGRRWYFRSYRNREDQRIILRDYKTNKTRAVAKATAFSYFITLKNS